jgi:glycerol-3-phosphate dehydrogenase (NAD(P)+)
MASVPRRDAAAPKADRPTIVVLGVGQMGLVCASMLMAGGGQTAGQGGGSGGRPEVVIWGRNADDVGELAQTRRSSRLPGFVLPEGVRVSIRDEELRRADVVVSAIPVQFSRDVWTRLRAFVPRETRVGVVSVAKGIENGTLLRPSQILAEVLGDDLDGKPRPVGVLTGPTIAAELARCLPATMIAASDDAAFAAQIQRMFSSSWLRVYTNSDMLGAEIAGAVKNVIAIAAGVLDGLKGGYNAKSALLARGLAEIARLGAAMGASPETFFGIAGVGDLATSCFSPEGRNRSLGEALGKGQKLDQYLKKSPYVVEGVPTTRSVMDLAKKYRVEMPITAAVHAVLFEGLDPLSAIGQLMSRELKGERVG